MTFKIKNINEYNKLKEEYLGKQVTIVEFDGKKLVTELDVFISFSKQISAPDYFGNNWDAVYDLLKDLSWLGDNNNIVIFITNVDELENKEFYKTLLSILKDSLDYWKDDSRIFEVVVFKK